MTYKIDSLLSQQEKHITIEKQIAYILEIEKTHQKTLAGADAEKYDFDVYLERITPIEQMTENSKIIQKTFVNIMFDGWVSETTSNYNTRLRAKYNIDVYGRKNAIKTQSGIIHSDTASAFESQRIAGLVRKILKHSVYQYLNLSGVLSTHFSMSQVYVPLVSENAPASQVVATRLVFEVTYDERYTENEYHSIEEIDTQIKIGDNGIVILNPPPEE